MSVSTFTLTLPAAPADDPPSALPVLPARAIGKDGRSWRVDTMRVLSRLAGRQLVLDENHSTYLLAPRGEPAPAMARLSEFSIREEGDIWAENVEWTKIGREKYENGEYLGISPVLVFDPPENPDNTDYLGTVVDIHSVALVNDPNLPMPALNSSDMAKNSAESEKPEKKPEQPERPEQPDIGAAIAQALAPLTARLEALAARLESTSAPAPASDAPASGAPASGAPASGAPAPAPNASAVPAELIESAFARYAKAGVIAPAGKEGFVAACSASLDAFTKLCQYYDNAPPIDGLNASDIDPPKPGDRGQGPQGADAAKICAMFGRKPDAEELRD